MAPQCPVARADLPHPCFFYVVLLVFERFKANTDRSARDHHYHFFWNPKTFWFSEEQETTGDLWLKTALEIWKYFTMRDKQDTRAILTDDSRAPLSYGMPRGYKELVPQMHRLLESLIHCSVLIWGLRSDYTPHVEAARKSHSVFSRNTWRGLKKWGIKVQVLVLVLRFQISVGRYPRIHLVVPPDFCR